MSDMASHVDAPAAGQPLAQERTGLREIDRALATNYDSLSPGQRRVIDHMLSDTRMAAVITGPELARALRVSESTVTRAAQALGFAGYPDLQERLRTQFVHGVSERLATTAVELGDGSAAAALRVMLEDAENIRRTVEELTSAEFDDAVEALLAAQRVFLFGSRGSLGLALMLGMGIRLLLPDVRILSETAGDLADQLIPLRPSDVLVAFSMRRVDRVAVDVVRQACTAGAHVIVVTDHRSSVITRLASNPLVVRSSSPRLTASYATGASLVNALITATSLRARDQASPTLQRAEQVWATWNVWTPDDLPSQPSEDAHAASPYRKPETE
jgi:DNA-binding MurR/RpiR family transcriptional regulator